MYKMLHLKMLNSCTYRCKYLYYCCCRSGYL
uniref:Uncharacterized protein n=1 Tax=Anguilla anguilla TaxID=7936 RepID=A0A0E9QZL7_ANGAN